MQRVAVLNIVGLSPLAYWHKHTPIEGVCRNQWLSGISAGIPGGDLHRAKFHADRDDPR